MLPFIHLNGSPYEQGVAHGRALRDRVAHNVAVYFERFEREAQLPRAEVLDRAARYARAIEDQNPGYHAGMRGIADGAGFTLEEIAALNVRYEILYYQFGKIALADEAAARDGHPEPDGCTAFAVLPEAAANGHLLVGQNWDWIPQVQGAVIHTTDADGFRSLAFTEAGIFGGKIGLNEAGVALCINGMTSTDDDWSRLRRPFHVRCHEILRARNLEAAARVITDEERSCSTNFLIAQAPDRALDIETSPDKCRRLGCDGGWLVHTNHFDDPAGLGVVEPPSERRPHSYNRRARLGAFLKAHHPVSVEDLERFLQDHDDHPFGLCRHEDWTEPPEEHYITVTSVVMDLHDRTMRLTDGPPCRSEYTEWAIGTDAETRGRGDTEIRL